MRLDLVSAVGECGRARILREMPQMYRAPTYPDVGSGIHDIYVSRQDQCGRRISINQSSLKEFTNAW